MTEACLFAGFVRFRGIGVAGESSSAFPGHTNDTRPWPLSRYPRMVDVISQNPAQQADAACQRALRDSNISTN